MESKGGFSYQRLEVWREAMDLSRLVYQLTKDFPKDERYGMVSQIRRAVTSIPVNIAEGRGRFSKKEQVQFFYNARGSLYETATLLALSMELGHLGEKDYGKAEALCLKTLSKLSGLINSLKGSHPTPSTLHPTPSQ